MTIKIILAATTLAAATPGLAQTTATPADSATQPAAEAGAKAETGAATMPSQGDAAPADADMQAAPPATQPQPTAPPTPAPTATPRTSAVAPQPETSSTQVAQVVAQEFPAYDTNRDGKLDKAEFGAWMVKLKTLNDPTTRAGTPQTAAWVNSAFAQADTDRSRALTRGELTGFLSQGRS